MGDIVINTSSFFTRLTKNTWVATEERGGWCVSNIGLIDGADSSLLVDTPATLRRMRRVLSEVKGLGASMIKYAANTHAHGDHTFGNCLLPDECEIYGTPQTRHECLRNGTNLTALWPDVDWGEIVVRPPTSLVDTKTVVHLGGVSVELINAGAGHTKGDLLVLIPEDSVLFAGDLVMNRTTPFYLFGDIVASRSTLEFILDLHPDFIVPGHGPMLPGVRGVLEGLEYLNWLQSSIDFAIDSDMDDEQIVQFCANSPFCCWAEPERSVANILVGMTALGARDYKDLEWSRLSKLMAASIGQETLTCHA